MSGGVPPSESFFWVSFISENILSFIDVAPLSLVQSYMDDVSIAVRDNEKLNEAIVEKECLFPYKATRLNIQSSRSHNVFTCIVESQCKIVNLVRMILVDLARNERQEAIGSTGERQKEARHIIHLLTQLGNLSNILAEVSQIGKKRHTEGGLNKQRMFTKQEILLKKVENNHIDVEFRSCFPKGEKHEGSNLKIISTPCSFCKLKMYLN
nr:kinesin-like protein KIN-12B [Tanacetum cinerariifolium]